MKESIRMMIQKYTGKSIFVISMYGRVEIAAGAANDLKTNNIYYYSLLYENEMEMLYFLIDPAIRKSIYYAKKRLNEIGDLSIGIIEGLLVNE